VDDVGQRHQLDHDLGHDSERAFRADEGAEQVISRGHATTVADPGQLARRGNELQPGHVMHREPVLKAVRPAGVLGDVTAHRADHLTRRVRRVEQPERRRRLAHRQVRDARLDDGPPAHRVDLQDLPHPGHHDEDPVLARQRAARKPGAAAAGHEGHAVPYAFPDHGGGFLRRAGQNHEGRKSPVRGEAVALVSAQLKRIRDDVAGSAGGNHVRYQLLDRLGHTVPPPVAPP
jgi:hypothetical protein